ncbi:hypothetical protein CALCODRAFT_87539 [Calocera cornea HHB12733]|uniref:Uncharacterized protein n=1 Tax=Calocera cornea HHB12733 TaxID=1353952 RepID=A0A165DD67_9BASI|nr:hypothetical protein CALCODRAFT_87539 [Calocera cornea HHB12733]
MACLIPANPDVAGIGVRLSFYIQAILTMAITLLIRLQMFKLDWGESHGNMALPRKELETLLESASTSILTLLLTGTALIISALIQVWTMKFTLYHAYLVWLLSVVNQISAGLAHTFYFLRTTRAYPSNDDRLSPEREVSKRALSVLEPRLHIVLFMGIYMALGGALAIWLSAELAQNSTDACTPEVSVAAMGFISSLTSYGVRLELLLFSAAIVVGSVGAFLVGLFLLSRWAWFHMPALIHRRLSAAIRWLHPSHTHAGRSKDADSRSPEPSMLEAAGVMNVVRGFLALTAVLEIAFWIWRAEKTIWLNQHLISPGEDDWTLGQTLSLLLLVLPLMDMVKRLREVIWGRKARRNAPESELDSPPWSCSAITRPEDSIHLASTGPVGHSTAINSKGPNACTLCGATIPDSSAARRLAQARHEKARTLPVSATPQRDTTTRIDDSERRGVEQDQREASQSPPVPSSPRRDAEANLRPTQHTLRHAREATDLRSQCNARHDDDADLLEMSLRPQPDNRQHAGPGPMPDLESGQM